MLANLVTPVSFWPASVCVCVCVCVVSVCARSGVFRPRTRKHPFREGDRVETARADSTSIDRILHFFLLSSFLDANVVKRAPPFFLSRILSAQFPESHGIRFSAFAFPRETLPARLQLPARRTRERNTEVRATVSRRTIAFVYG